MEKLLLRVEKPARYTGGELNAAQKSLESLEVRGVLAYPDVYEVGMANLGLSILYERVNSLQWAWCERAYLPWPDFARLLREHQVPLYSLESGEPVATADFLGFTLQYELTFPGVLEFLDLSGLPLRSTERTEAHPLVLGGGPCAVNPEPVAEFFDAFLLGDGEEAIVELCELLRQAKQEGWERGEVKRRLARLPGWYVPEYYHPRYDETGKLVGLDAAEDVPATVQRRVLADLEAVPYPRRPVVPFLEVTHDRAMVEVMRGCTRGCRFCQAGTTYRPVRERKVETLVEQARQLLEATGYDELALVSLSSTDYSMITELVERLLPICEPRRVNLSLPSLRVDALDIALAERLAMVRKGGMTLAPEAGSQRLRDVINKQVSEAQLLEATEAAFRAGWNTLKLYFMLGLPTETDEDLLALAELVQRVLEQGKRLRGNKVKINVSLATFVPKPHTPFQWCGQITMEEIERRQQLLKTALAPFKQVRLKFHDPRQSALEALLARGDRRLGKVLELAWRKGARFESWREYFDLTRWLEALAAVGLSLENYANREFALDEVLPWEHLFAGVSKAFCAAEYRKALAAECTSDCRWGPCTACGACSGEVGLKLARDA